jgi:hypothetical protein
MMMLNELPIHWLVWGIAAYVSMKCAISLATILKDRLQALLVEHVKKQQIESLKRRRISELRDKIRQKKERELESEDASKKNAA